MIAMAGATPLGYSVFNKATAIVMHSHIPNTVATHLEMLGIPYDLLLIISPFNRVLAPKETWAPPSSGASISGIVPNENSSIELYPGVKKLEKNRLGSKGTKHMDIL